MLWETLAKSFFLENKYSKQPFRVSELTQEEEVKAEIFFLCTLCDSLSPEHNMTKAREAKTDNLKLLCL